MIQIKENIIFLVYRGVRFFIAIISFEINTIKYPTVKQIAYLSLSIFFLITIPTHADFSTSTKKQLTQHATQVLDQTLIDSYQGYTTKNVPILRNVKSPLKRDVDKISRQPNEKFITLGKFSGIDIGKDTFTTEPPPHLRVEFLIQTLENIAVKNGGAIQDMRIKWSAHSHIATNEPDFKPDSWIPPPGNSLQFNNPPIYIGMVTNGCNNVPVYPINFYSEIYNDAGIHGSFGTADNTTIQPNGYWNFSYSIRVSDNHGNESDIRIKGIVRAICEW